METEKSKTVTQKPLFATPLVPQNQAAQPSSSGVISWASKLKGNSKQVQFPKSSASSTVAVSTPPVSARTRNDSSMSYSTTATSQISETTNTDDDVEVIINHQEIEQVSRYNSILKNIKKNFSTKNNFLQPVLFSR